MQDAAVPYRELLGPRLAEEPQTSGRELRASAGRSCGPPMPAASELTAKPATERMGLLSSSARMQSSARGRLRAAAVSLKPQIKNEKGRIKNESLHPMLIRFLRGTPATSRSCGPPLPQAAARCALAGANSKFKIQNSELQIRDTACGARLRRRGAAGLRAGEAAARQSLRD